MNRSVDPATLPHDNRAHVLIGAVVGVLIIATIAVGLRIYTRAYLLRRVGPDDYLILLALVLAIATGVSECVNTRHGLGTHVWDLKPPDDIIAYLKNFYVTIALYNAGLLAIKMAFLVQYYRVLVIKRFQTTCIVAAILVGAWSLSQILICLFLCTPIAGFWDASLNAKCVPTRVQWYINAGGNIVTDIIIFVLPLPVLTHLDLPKMQKISLVGIFSLGFFTCAISVIRIRFLKMGADFTNENVEASIWSITELCSGITCCCLPPLRPLVSKLVPKFTGTFQLPPAGCLRISGSQARRASKGSKRTCQNSKGNNSVGVGSQDGICRSNDTDRGTSGDIPESLAFPEPAHVSPNTSHLGWIQPGVMTTISTGNRESWVSHENPSTIHITRDITMQNISPC